MQEPRSKWCVSLPMTPEFSCTWLATRQLLHNISNVSYSTVSFPINGYSKSGCSLECLQLAAKKTHTTGFPKEHKLAMCLPALHTWQQATGNLQLTARKTLTSSSPKEHKSSTFYRLCIHGSKLLACREKTCRLWWSRPLLRCLIELAFVMGTW